MQLSVAIQIFCVGVVKKVCYAFRYFTVASSMLYHCTMEHVGNEESIQCHWPRCDSTVRAKWSMVTHLQDHHCNEAALQAAAKRRREGLSVVLILLS